jgi:SAM-dependent methyltransferase
MEFSLGKKWISYIKGEIYYYYERFYLRNVNAPVNFGYLDSSSEAVQRDVEYALGTADPWIKLLPSGEEYLNGKRILEIGPGINFGLSLIMACYGAEVMVVDRFLPPWNPDYHPRFYALLRDKIAERGPLVDLTPIDAILSRGDYPKSSLSLYTCSLEKSFVISDQSIDLIFSNAVLEHLYNLETAFSHLARITKPGGLGIHQVDFRDHRDYSRPLEHLLFKEAEFYGKFKAKQGEFGNRIRPREMWQLLESVGFEVKEFRPNIVVEEEYLAEFLPRLRQAKKSRYRDYNAEDLRYISGLFIVERKHT